MIYQNVYLHNVRDVFEKDGGIRWRRMPKSVSDQIDERGQGLLCNSTGVEIRFVIEAPEAILTVRALTDPAALTNVRVFHGDIQAGWQSHETEFQEGGICKIKIKRPDNIEKLKKIASGAGSTWSPDVVRVIPNISFIFIRADGVRPPTADEMPKKALLCYGSSITHGSNAYTQLDTWAHFIAHGIGYDLFNLGMPGNCKMEHPFVSHLASEPWDIAIAELGINVLSWDRETAYSRAFDTISGLAKTGKPVIAISPFYCCDDINGGIKAAMWREVVSEVCRTLALPNVTYISGTDLLGEASLLSADLVHPSIYGIRQIGERLLPVLKKIANENK